MSEQPVPVTPSEPSENKGFSVVALVSTITGALSYVLVLFHGLMKMSTIVALVLAPLSALVAIITGHISHKQIKESNGQLGGLKLSRAGLIMGYLYYALGIIGLILAVLGATALLHLLGIR